MSSFHIYFSRDNVPLNNEDCDETVLTLFAVN
jgi:hypothetical protein